MTYCVAFLQWALPQLGLRWEGFRRVHGQVCKRIGRRVRELGLKDLDEYRARLRQDRSEWNQLESLCRVTISRFYRDRGVFDRLTSDVLPVLAASAAGRRERVVRAWCAGCGAGEEVYTLALLWRFRLAARFPELTLSVLGTDADEHQIARARRGCYRPSSLRELPEGWGDAAFVAQNGGLCVDSALREGVELRIEDLRQQLPAGFYDLVLCRNLAFTYFAEPIQRKTALRIAERLRVDGALVLGKHERLPEGLTAFGPWSEPDRIYRRIG
jgi:chemotaxis protein methyltransferase CheR